MSDEKLPEPFEGMLQRLVDSGEASQMAGIDIDRLRTAMSAPGAVETVNQIQALGANARAAVGDPAPDFELPYLPGHGGSEGETVLLSEFAGKRPVALIFGSYT